MSRNPLAFLAPLALIAAQPAIAQTAPAPAAAPREISEEEMYCVYAALDEEALFKLAEMVAYDRSSAIGDMTDAAEAGLESCAAKWKWTDQGKTIGLYLAAATAGAEYHAHQLKDRLTEKQLLAIYHKLSEDDRRAMTVAGSRDSTPAQGQALTARFTALAAREGVREADYQAVVLYFIAVSRGIEAKDLWTLLGRRGGH
jgi:hypothetical protein